MRHIINKISSAGREVTFHLAGKKTITKKYSTIKDAAVAQKEVQPGDIAVVDDNDTIVAFEKGPQRS